MARSPITPDLIDGMVSRIVERFAPLKVILFGACARGDATAESDVDLLVVMPDGTHTRQAATEMFDALVGCGAAKDIIVATPYTLKRFGDTPGLIYRTVLREGKTLYERPRSNNSMNNSPLRTPRARRT